MACGLFSLLPIYWESFFFFFFLTGSHFCGAPESTYKEPPAEWGQCGFSTGVLDSCRPSRKKSGGGTPRGLWEDFLQSTTPLPPSQNLLSLSQYPPAPGGKVSIQVLQELGGEVSFSSSPPLKWSIPFLSGRDHLH